MGKGLLFNKLVGQRIYGGDLYTQITDIEKLLGSSTRTRSTSCSSTSTRPRLAATRARRAG